MTNDVLQIRVEKKVKNEASNILDNIGLDMSTAIRMFLNSIIKTKSIPFDVCDDKKNHIVKRNIVLEDLNKYMDIADSSFKNTSDIDKYIKESRRDRKFY